ncbi:MAG: DUF3368 domain-containing protein [Euryarchaeota archaeon]|nr:DUF3368 domain-containing protein [Euryarchaeota archaeon]
MIVVSNSGPLIALAKLEILHLLEDFFGEVVIPEEVWREVVERGRGKPGSESIRSAGWIKVKKVENLSVDVLSKELDRGEAEAIVLAKTLNADLLIMDERIPREIAKSLGIKVTGTLALICEALRRGIIKGSYEDIVLKMRIRGIWVGDEVVEEVRKRGFNCQ